MKRINSLSVLLMEELDDLLSAETQWAEALPKTVSACQSSELRSALESSLKITLEHVRRLQNIFSNIGQNPSKTPCKAMKGFIREIEDIICKQEKSPAVDAAMIGVVQRAQQFEISRYKKARVHGAELGHTKIVEIFTKTLNEEREKNLRLNELAQLMINAHAMEPQSGGFYIPEGKFKRKSIKKKSKGTDVSRFIDEGNPNV